MSQTQYESIEELFNSYPWRTPSKFIPLAKKYGFSNENEIRKFLKEKAFHDEKIQKPKFLPIFSSSKNEFQFDTVFINKLIYLMFINVNTRKVYAYAMNNKNSKSVIEALNKFFDDVKSIKTLVSDQDPAYLNTEVLSLLKSKNINYRTTEDNNHNVLGIINRFVRTIRDLSFKDKNISNEKVLKLIRIYNNTPHKSLNNKAPNEITENDENEYIQRKISETDEIKNEYNFEIGDRVRIVLDKNKLTKNRTNLSTEAFLIDDISGNQYVIKAADGSVDSYPRYRLKKCDDRYKIAETIKNGKRGVIEKIISYDEKSDKYKVIYDEGTKDNIPSKNLREGNPLLLSRMEREFWAGKNNIPLKIRRWT